MYYRFFAALIRGILSPFSRCLILHPERACQPGPWILAANHISHFDPPLLSLASGRMIHWMAMEELFRPRFFGWLLRRVGAFPVRRGRPDRAALRTAVEYLRRGRVVGVFPEGGIRDGEASLLRAGELRPGLVLVAGLAQAPVRPAVILGSDRLYALQRSRRWRRWERTPVWIGFGELIPPPGPSAEERTAFGTRLQEAMRALAEEVARTYGLQEEDWPRSPQQRVAEEDAR